MSQTLKAVRGTRDLLPPETALWNHIEATARAVFARYNFGEIRTPVFEDTALFARGVGEETDIVSKEMYTWEDRARAQSEKTQSLTLRPENTAGVVRAYIEHQLGETGQLQKLYYIGPQFRRERPQKGRYRQFSQIGAEVIGPPSSGSESPLRDAEVLEMLATLLDEMGITGWTLELNSVGSSADRARYNEVLRTALDSVVSLQSPRRPAHHRHAPRHCRLARRSIEDALCRRSCSPRRSLRALHAQQPPGAGT
jgi:histidyl-tRNA synthetase